MHGSVQSFLFSVSSTWLWLLLHGCSFFKNVFMVKLRLEETDIMEQGLMNSSKPNCSFQCNLFHNGLVQNSNYLRWMNCYHLFLKTKMFGIMAELLLDFHLFIKFLTHLCAESYIFLFLSLLWMIEFVNNFFAREENQHPWICERIVYKWREPCVYII